MKKFSTLALAALASVMAASAATPITAVPTSEDNGKVYTIVARYHGDNQTRGGFYVKSDAPSVLTICGTTVTANKSDYPNVDVAYNAADRQQQFSIISYGDKYYIYSVASKGFLVNNPSNVGINISTEAADFFTITKDGNDFLLKSRGEAAGLVNVTWWEAVAGIKRTNATIDEGNAFTISLVEGVTLSDADLTAALRIIDPNYGKLDVAKANAQDLLEKTGVGYPVSDARAALVAAINAENATTASINTAVAAYLAADVNMPVGGSAYTIRFVYSDGSTRYMGWDENAGRLNVSTESYGKNGIFVVKHHEVDNTYALYNVATGKFLVFYADGKHGAGNVGNGFSSDYKVTFGETDEECSIKIERKTTASHGSISAEQAFGTLVLKAMMHGNSNENEDHYFIAGTSNFHNTYAADVHFQPSGPNFLSSFAIFEEVANPIADVTLAGGHETLDNLVAYHSSYAAALPVGVTAYFISGTKEDKAVVKKFAEAGQAIPANTPVLLSSANTAVKLLPATKEELAAFPTGYTNQLAYGDAANKPVLGTSASFVTNSEAGNQVYLNADNGAYALDASDTSTSISEIEGVNPAVRAIYDLQGRKVSKATRGLYIINGVKTLVK